MDTSNEDEDQIKNKNVTSSNNDIFLNYKIQPKNFLKIRNGMFHLLCTILF
jgi:hypothetical protein